MTDRGIEHSRNRRAVEFFETLRVPADHEKPVRADARPVGELEFDPLRERPAAEVDCLAAGVVQFDELQVIEVVRRMIHDFVDDHPRVGERRNASEE